MLTPSRTPQTRPPHLHGVTRRAVLHAGLAAGVTLSAWPLQHPAMVWGAEDGQPKRGGILRVRGFDPPHFDPHLPGGGFRTQATLSFVYSTLLRHRLGPAVPPGICTVEPHLAERWDMRNETTYLFHLRQGVKWHNKPPLNGRELVAEDVKFTFDRFMTVQGNPARDLLAAVDRVEVVDRYTVKFILHEPFVWLLDTLAQTSGMWIIAPEVVQHFGDLKPPESAIGTGPFILEHYEPNVKIVFTRNPQYFRDDQPYVDRVEWMVIQDASTGLAMYRTGQLDCGPMQWWIVRQADLESLQKSHPHLRYQDFQAIGGSLLALRTDQRPFNDVRVRRAISLAIDRQALIEAVWVRGQPTPAIAPGLTAWSLPIDQLGAGAQYYQYNPHEARRLLADAGFATGLQTALYAMSGFGGGTDHLDAVQLIQRFLKDVGITAELRLQEFGAYVATTAQGKFEGMAYGLIPLAWNADRPFYGDYIRRENMSHVNDPTLTAMFKAQRRTQDVEAHKGIVFDMQRYAVKQQYYVYLIAVTSTASWQPYVKNYAPNSTFDYGGRAAALWLDR
jgi:peptide/nickel transport system substrate-binding protein